MGNIDDIDDDDIDDINNIDDIDDQHNATHHTESHNQRELSACNPTHIHSKQISSKPGEQFLR